MDRLEAMRTLVAAVDGGSLSAASRTLMVPLPTVSRRVSDLEAFLGSRLVVRTSRKLLLTESGTAYVASARRVLEEVAEAERAASGEYRAPRGELLITAPIAFGALKLTPIVHDFLAVYPDVSVRLVLSDEITDWWRTTSTSRSGSDISPVVLSSLGAWARSGRCCAPARTISVGAARRLSQPIC